MFVVAAAGIAAAIAGWEAIGIPLIVVAAALGAFFRDPERLSSAPESAIVSGADGRVCAIGVAPIPGIQSGAIYTLISVFMSPLDVHVNRAPVGGDVMSLEYVKGEFHAAFRDVAGAHNERNLIRIKDHAGRDHALVQVAGYLARRIVCRVRPHQRLERGQRIGLIAFGSRVDHFLPRQCRVLVEVGDRVRAGETVIGEVTE